MLKSKAGAGPREAYLRQSIAGMDRGRLVLAMYEEACLELHRVLTDIPQHRLELAHRRLVKVQEIVNELLISLNLEAGELSRTLRAVYQDLLQRLMTANLQKDVALVTAVLNVLTDMKDAWGEMLQQLTREVPPAGAKAARLGSVRI
ncbi:MAG: flagellar export chaperone FliS [Deltaproteobacteria bacterium]|nr:flagellar export chaperone FliS [Deltaproteobacteria bacterium]